MKTEAEPLSQACDGRVGLAHVGEFRAGDGPRVVRGVGRIQTDGQGRRNGVCKVAEKGVQAT